MIFKIIIILIIIFFIIGNDLNVLRTEKKNYFDLSKLKNKGENKEKIYISENSFNKCYLPFNDSNIKIIHLIITRFLIEFYKLYGFPNKLYEKDYIPNGIRVVKKYLIPSLENQSCKNFIWILMLGNNVNITLVKSLLDSNNSFDIKVIYLKDIKPFIRNVSIGYNVLITTRIDYDDCIYYDAVNDARKAINFDKPLFLYGYNRGVYYFEFNNNFYDYHYNYTDGAWSVFLSLILVLDKVNDTYTIYDLGDHSYVRKKILKSYKSYGIKELNYEPANFEHGEPKFIYVRQKFSGSYNVSKQILKRLVKYNFNLSKFYGK